ncbi:hypothetical protein [Ideonella livida]|uniref:Uncharacterized protein n=1 Tax=Ideonella livida TaxID=2707176 RepID=A0A7C9PGC9_9BURK|nr:hypothetical protein [Ideonella livida]NDY91068.1 hypothetical protein [Ideonella livida]
MNAPQRPSVPAATAARPATAADPATVAPASPLAPTAPGAPQPKFNETVVTTGFWSSSAALQRGADVQEVDPARLPEDWRERFFGIKK